MLWFARGAGYFVAARLWQIRPRFRFAGAGSDVRYGSAMIAVQLCWFVQSQADVFIGGRLLDPHRLGLYTTALFLTQILATKFVPPLNEVAFAAYSRIQERPETIAVGFPEVGAADHAGRLALLFRPGRHRRAAGADVLGWRWIEAAPLVPILAMAMPFMTLQILFAPATNATRPAGAAVAHRRCSARLLMPPPSSSASNGARPGSPGPGSAAWRRCSPRRCELSLPAIGVSRATCSSRPRPALAAAAAMAGVVVGVRLAASPDSARGRGWRCSCGAERLAYAGLLLAVRRRSSAR